MHFVARSSSRRWMRCTRRGEARQELRLLDGRVAAADDGDLLVAEERAVARRAPRDAAAGVLGLAGDAELARHRAGRDDDRVREDLAAVERSASSPSPTGSMRLDRLERAEARAELLGLLVHQLADLGAGDALGEAGVVLDPVGRDDLAARADRVSNTTVFTRARAAYSAAARPAGPPPTIATSM